MKTYFFTLVFKIFDAFLAISEDLGSATTATAWRFQTGES